MSTCSGTLCNLLYIILLSAFVSCHINCKSMYCMSNIKLRPKKFVSLGYDVYIYKILSIVHIHWKAKLYAVSQLHVR